jgi:hypothetical protein
MRSREGEQKEVKKATNLPTSQKLSSRTHLSTGGLSRVKK